MTPNRPSRFNPYQDDPDRIDPDAQTRRVERPTTNPLENEQDWREMVQPNWRERRRERGQQRPGLGAQLPIFSSGFFNWVSQGGWKVLAAAAAGIFVLLLVVLFTGRAPEDQVAGNQQSAQTEPTADVPTAPIVVGSDDQPAEQPTAAPAQQQFFVVSGTGVEGLFLRDQPGGNILKTMPEGTRVEQIGPDQEASGFVWKHIREPGGLEGWAAANWLQPAQ